MMNDGHKYITVLYSFVDGMHFFTAGDDASDGLCVAHKNLHTAYKEVDKQLTYLLLSNHAKKSTIKPLQSVDEFAAWIESVKATAKNDQIIPVPGGQVKWEKRELSAA